MELAVVGEGGVFWSKMSLKKQRIKCKGNMFHAKGILYFFLPSGSKGGEGLVHSSY